MVYAGLVGIDVITYPDRDPTYDAACEGTLARNGIYGRGIVNALTATIG